MNTEVINKRTNLVILNFSAPSVIAMLLSSLTTIVDGIFVGKFISKEALAAIQLGLPVLYFYLYYGLGLYC